MDTTITLARAGTAAAPPAAETPSRRRRLGEFLVGEGLITPKQLDEALRVQRESAPGKRLGQILVEQAVLAPDRLVAALGRALQAPGGRKDQLGAILVEAGVLTGEQLDAALRLQRRMGLRLGEVLLQLDFVAEAPIKEALCRQVGVAFVDPEELSIESGAADLVSRKYAQRHRVVPIAQGDGTITLLMADPTNGQVLRDVEVSTGRRVQAVTSTQPAFQKAFSRVYG